jgi:TonB family protein
MQPFKRHLYDQIGSAWYRSTEANREKIAAGTVRIALTATTDGKITQLQVLSNTSDALLERICLDAIRQAKIPPIPPELLADGKYQDDLSFTIYPDGKGPKPTKGTRPNQSMQPTASPRTASLLMINSRPFEPALLSSAVADLVLVRSYARSVARWSHVQHRVRSRNAVEHFTSVARRKVARRVALRRHVAVRLMQHCSLAHV